MNPTQFWQFGKSQYPFVFYLEFDVSLTNTPNAEVINLNNYTIFAPDFSASINVYSIHRILKKISKNKFLVSMEKSFQNTVMSYHDFYNYYKTNWLNMSFLFDSQNSIQDTYIQYAKVYLNNELLGNRYTCTKNNNELTIAQTYNTFRQLSFHDIKDNILKIVILNN